MTRRVEHLAHTFAAYVAGGGAVLCVLTGHQRAEVVRLTARVATLESLATGPRSLTIDAAACDAIDGSNAGPQHVDATGREVLP